MIEWIEQNIGSATLTPTVILAVFALGIIGAFGSCCNVAMIGVLAGFSRSLGSNHKKRDILLAGLSFMIGVTLIFGAIGLAAGLISQTALSLLGQYWKYFAGFILVFLGAITLDLLPFKLPRFKQTAQKDRRGTTGAIIYGFLIGAGLAGVTTLCNPPLYLALGVAALQLNSLHAGAVMSTFAIGYALPFAIVLIGLGFGISKITSITGKSAPVIKIILGIILIILGIYILATA